ncbi:uncharacterized protein BDR25DRAFT_1795 [Lindgomyces ingoldianus]|uniref:Uncharacterized protein n=1 Tax=Lindgomyces ingoldianus TaxID=673940 RepID=A0ACB6RGQ7_9PLEO|nr:uncharacterized protein BDR25DRAFT_1795 [Lindgomyces ingoldianus]KAF2477515.1 hypothetical protein BDR25DRAFT_1795 [Lindgomyces ingoldianus]
MRHDANTCHAESFAKWPRLSSVLDNASNLLLVGTGRRGRASAVLGMTKSRQGVVLINGGLTHYSQSARRRRPGVFCFSHQIALHCLSRPRLHENQGTSRCFVLSYYSSSRLSSHSFVSYYGTCIKFRHTSLSYRNTQRVLCPRHLSHLSSTNHARVCLKENMTAIIPRCNQTMRPCFCFSVYLSIMSTEEQPGWPQAAQRSGSLRQNAVTVPNFGY